MVILICHLIFFDPRLNLLLGLSIFRLFEKLPHEAGETAVLEEDGAIGQPLLAPLRQLAHFQFRNGGELALDLGAVMHLVIPVIVVAGRHDARGQADKDRD